MIFLFLAIFLCLGDSQIILELLNYWLTRFRHSGAIGFVLTVVSCSLYTINSCTWLDIFLHRASEIFSPYIHSHIEGTQLFCENSLMSLGFPCSPTLHEQKEGSVVKELFSLANMISG